MSRLLMSRLLMSRLLKSGEPRVRGLTRAGALHGGQARPLYHDHRQPEPARGGELAVGRGGARVLADDDLDPFPLEQARFRLGVEGAAGRQHPGSRQVDRELVEHADQVFVLGRGSKRSELQPTDAQKNPARREAKRDSRLHHVGYGDPTVTLDGTPGGPLDAQQGRLGELRGSRGVPRHLRREGVRRIDQGVPALGLQVRRESLHTAEATDAIRNSWILEALRATCEREQRLVARVRS